NHRIHHRKVCTRTSISAQFLSGKPLIKDQKNHFRIGQALKLLPLPPPRVQAWARSRPRSLFLQGTLEFVNCPKESTHGTPHINVGEQKYCVCRPYGAQEGPLESNWQRP